MAGPIILCGVSYKLVDEVKASDIDRGQICFPLIVPSAFDGVKLLLIDVDDFAYIHHTVEACENDWDLNHSLRRKADHDVTRAIIERIKAGKYEGQAHIYVNLLGRVADD